MERLTEELNKLRMDLTRQEALASQRGKVIESLKTRSTPNGLPGGLPFNVRLSELSQTLSSTSRFSMRRLKDLLLRLRLMLALRCFQGPLIVLPCQVVLGFLRGLALLSRLLGLHLLTPLLPQIGARCKASRLFFSFFFYLIVSWRGAWYFCIAPDLDFSLIY